MQLNPTENLSFSTTASCRWTLGKNPDSKSVNCGFGSRGWISERNCEACTHQNETETPIIIRAIDDQPETPSVISYSCPHSETAPFLIFGRICNPLHAKGKEAGTCFNFDKPELVKTCPSIHLLKQQNILSERITSDFLASLPQGVGVQ